MNELKHTPGPFTVGKTCVGIPAIFAEGSNTAIAMLGARSGDQLSLLPNHEANASLIAAAPDMLAALEELAGDIEDRFDMSSPSTNPGMKSAVFRAREAISKAKGGQL